LSGCVPKLSLFVNNAIGVNGAINQYGLLPDDALCDSGAGDSSQILLHQAGVAVQETR